MPVVTLLHVIQASSGIVATLFMPFVTSSSYSSLQLDSRQVIHATPRDRCYTVQVLPIVRRYNV